MSGVIREYVGWMLCQKRLRLSSKVDECKPLPTRLAPSPFSLLLRGATASGFVPLSGFVACAE